MTVSPRRAQDGTRQPSGNTEPASCPPSESAVCHDGDAKTPSAETLPPTLFELPNLSGGPAENETKSPATPTTPPAPSAVVEPDPVPKEQGTEDQPLSLGDELDRILPVAPVPPAPQATSTVDADPEPIDPLPAGRTWMEKIGSHALVLVMLLIVVAAALLTGQGSGDTSYDDSVAENAESELDFELGEKVQLPLPDHTHLHQSEEFAMDSPDKTASATEVKQDSIDVSEEAEANLTVSTASVALSAPKVNEEDLAVEIASTELENVDTELSAAELIAQSTPRIETNKFFHHSESVDAVAVSNRVMTEKVPTLEDLETGSSETAAPARQDGPNFTRTPFGLSDSLLMEKLEQYIQDAASSAASADKTTTQNSN